MMTFLNILIGRILIMENNQEISQKEKELRDAIRKQVIRLEKQNYAMQPDGLSEKEMIERIKKIIEQEVNKYENS